MPLVLATRGVAGSAGDCALSLWALQSLGHLVLALLVRAGFSPVAIGVELLFKKILVEVCAIGLEGVVAFRLRSFPRGIVLTFHRDRI